MCLMFFNVIVWTMCHNWLRMFVILCGIFFARTPSLRACSLCPHLPVDVSTAALPMQVPPTATAILPMDLRVVDHPHHHHQQPSFGLVPQPHPTPPASTASPTSSEPGRGPVISKSGLNLIVWSCGLKLFPAFQCKHTLRLRRSDW